MSKTRQALDRRRKVLENREDEFYRRFEANGNKLTPALEENRKALSRSWGEYYRHSDRWEAESHRQDCQSSWHEDRRMLNNPRITYENPLKNFARRLLGIPPRGLGARPKSGVSWSSSAPAWGSGKRVYSIVKNPDGAGYAVNCNGRITCRGTMLGCDVHIERNRRPQDEYRGKAK